MKEKINQNKDMSFKDYKILATKNDIKNLSKAIKIKGYENIPIFDSLIYSIRMQYHLMGIDRGPLRQEVFKYIVIFIFKGLIYISLILFLLSPLFIKKQFKKALERTKERIEKGDI